MSRVKVSSTVWVADRRFAGKDGEPDFVKVVDALAEHLKAEAANYGLSGVTFDPNQITITPEGSALRVILQGG